MQVRSISDRWKKRAQTINFSTWLETQCHALTCLAKSISSHPITKRRFHVKACLSSSKKRAVWSCSSRKCRWATTGLSSTTSQVRSPRQRSTRTQRQLSWASIHNKPCLLLPELILFRPSMSLALKPRQASIYPNRSSILTKSRASVQVLTRQPITPTCTSLWMSNS